VDEEDREGEYVRVGDMYYQLAMFAAECGYLIKTAVA
jgi:hypothetical protein